MSIVTSTSTFRIYRFHFDSALHLGDARPNDYANSADILHSDGLHAAILATLAKMGQVVPGVEGPDYSLSSCFPFGTGANGKTTYFFPRPLISFNLGQDNIDYAKELKGIRWVDSDYLGRLLSGERIDFGGSKRPHLRGKYLTADSIDTEKLMTQASGQRVTVSRSDEEDATPFISQRLFFGEDAGLYCLFRGDANAQKTFDSALSLLQYEGLGTDRNNGNGHFTFQTDSLVLKPPANGNYAINLSLFCPESKQQLSKMLSGKHTAYRIIRRGGWLTGMGHQTKRKRSISMFAEGSLLTTEASEAGRAAINLVPLDPKGESVIDHPVWRNGRAIFLPCKIK